MLEIVKKAIRKKFRTLFSLTKVRRKEKNKNKNKQKKRGTIYLNCLDEYK